MFVKVCGITRLSDAEHAVHHGATAIGFVFWPQSPRAVTAARAAAIAAALPEEVTTVGVFVNETPEAIRRIVAAVGLRAVQLHGDESASLAAAFGVPVIKAVTLATVGEACRSWPPGTRFLLDAADPVRRGGTGVRVDWTAAARIAGAAPVVLAGGLTPENVTEAITRVRPAGVDVSSGVEAAPGVKDVDKVARFVERAREALAAAAGAPR